MILTKHDLDRLGIKKTQNVFINGTNKSQIVDIIKDKVPTTASIVLKDAKTGYVFYNFESTLVSIVTEKGSAFAIAIITTDENVSYEIELYSLDVLHLYIEEDDFEDDQQASGKPIIEACIDSSQTEENIELDKNFELFQACGIDDIKIATLQFGPNIGPKEIACILADAFRRQQSKNNQYEMAIHIKRIENIADKKLTKHNAQKYVGSIIDCLSDFQIDGIYDLRKRKLVMVDMINRPSNIPYLSNTLIDEVFAEAQGDPDYKHRIKNLMV